MGIFVRRHAEAAARFNKIAILHAESDSNIENVQINFSENDGLIELIIKYPKIKNKLPLVSKLLKLKRYNYFYDYGFKFLKSKGFNPKIIHCNIMNPSGLIAKRWKKKFNIPFIITEHWTGFLQSDGRYMNNKLLKLTLPKIAKYAEKVLPVSLDLKEALNKNNLGENFQIIHNVVNTEKFYPQVKLKNKFIVVADLVNKQKNIIGIINAFLKFSDTNPNISLSIVGGGQDEKLIIQHIKKQNLTKKIKLHGRLSPEEINALLGESFASILFSNYENLPCVIIEAFAAGVPFISSEVGGIKEIINTERGILIPRQNENELVKAMNTVLVTEWDQKVIREYAINKFSYDKIGKKFDIIYKNIIGH